MRSLGILAASLAAAIQFGNVALFAQRGHGGGMGGGMSGAHGAPGLSAGPGRNEVRAAPPANAASGSRAASSTSGVSHANRAPAQLSQNTALSSKLQTLLPAGTNLQTAASGFKNLGQFTAAVHVSHNLNIPFSQLKAEMTTGDHDSLGQAIHDLRPDLSRHDANLEAKVAERQAKRDLKEVKEEQNERTQ